MDARDLAVWQRVTAGREAPASAALTVEALLRREAEHAVAYEAMAKQTGMPRRRLFQQLARQANQQCHLLQTLIAGKKQTPPAGGVRGSSPGGSAKSGFGR